MMFRSLGALAVLLMTTSLSPAAAFDPQGIAAQLQSEGYTSIEIKIGDNIAKVEATKGTTKIEVTYDIASGDVIKTETETVDPQDDDVPGGVVGHDSNDDDASDDGPNHDLNDDHGGDDEADDDHEDNSGPGGGDDEHEDDNGGDSGHDDDNGGDDDGGDDDGEHGDNSGHGGGDDQDD